MSSLAVATPPLKEPVTLDVVKNHLRVTISNDDALIGVYLQAARELVESESGRALVNTAFVQIHDRFPHRDEWQYGIGYTYRAPRYAHHSLDERLAIKLLRSPLVAVSRITYLDTAGALQTLYPTPESWQPGTAYVIGNQVTDSTNLQQVTAATEAEDGGQSLSGQTAPTWNATLNGTTTDGELTWKNLGVAPAGDFLVDRTDEPARLAPLHAQVWPLTYRQQAAVRVYYTAGYGLDGLAAPATLRVAIMQATGVSYEFREAITPEQLRAMPWYDRLIYSQRVSDWNPTK